MTLRKKLEEAINSVSAESGSNTPDFILADYMMVCLAACGALWVVMMDGWRESKGVKAEIDIANELGIPVKYI